MNGRTEQQFDDEYADEFDDQTDEDHNLPDENIQKVTDARRRLEAYWEKKALDEDLKDLDDWD